MGGNKVAPKARHGDTLSLYKRETLPLFARGIQRRCRSLSKETQGSFAGDIECTIGIGPSCGT